MNREPSPMQGKRGPGLMLSVPVKSPEMLLPDIRDYLGHFPSAKIQIEVKGGELLMTAKGWMK